MKAFVDTFPFKVFYAVYFFTANSFPFGFFQNTRRRNIHSWHGINFLCQLIFFNLTNRFNHQNKMYADNFKKLLCYLSQLYCMGYFNQFSSSFITKNCVSCHRARVVVCLEESLYLHNIRDMKVLHTIRDTPPNPRGLCALSSNSENCYLAYPGSSSVGEVQIFDAMNLVSALWI